MEENRTTANEVPVIELRHVDKHFGELHVLKDINLSVKKGEVVVVIGPSGSGKSTLCRTINDWRPLTPEKSSSTEPRCLRRSEAGRAPFPDWHGIPIFQPVCPQDHSGQCDHRADGCTA